LNFEVHRTYPIAMLTNTTGTTHQIRAAKAVEVAWLVAASTNFAVMITSPL